MLIMFSCLSRTTNLVMLTSSWCVCFQVIFISFSFKAQICKNTFFWWWCKGEKTSMAYIKDPLFEWVLKCLWKDLHTCCPNVKSMTSIVFLNTDHRAHTHIFMHRKFEDEICWWKRENTGTQTALEGDRGRQNETGRWETENWSAIV